LWSFGERWNPPSDPDHQRVIHIDCGHEAIAVAHCSHCGEQITRHNVRIEPPNVTLQRLGVTATTA
jgi:predicted NBD/HSP70 family sugar kinase